MIPRTSAPNARGSMEEDHVVSNAETFETFATHYGNVLQKHKKKIRNHVINNPPRRSPRLLEKMLKQQENTANSAGKKQQSSRKKIRRSYYADPEDLIPVMSLSVLRTKRNYELMSGGDYTPAPIKCRRSATVSFRSDDFEFNGDDIVSVNKSSASKCVPETNDEERPPVKSIIQIKQDFLKNLVHWQIPTESPNELKSEPSFVQTEEPCNDCFKCEARQVSTEESCNDCFQCEEGQILTESPNKMQMDECSDANKQSEEGRQVPTEMPSEISSYPNASAQSDSYQGKQTPSGAPSEVIAAFCSDLTGQSCNECYQYLQERQLSTESPTEINIYPPSDEVKDQESFQCLQVNENPIESQEGEETVSCSEVITESCRNLQELRVSDGNSTEIMTTPCFIATEQSNYGSSHFRHDDDGRLDDGRSEDGRSDDGRSNDGKSDDGRPADRPCDRHSDEERFNGKCSNNRQSDVARTEDRSSCNGQSDKETSEDESSDDNQSDDGRPEDRGSDDRPSEGRRSDDGQSISRQSEEKKSAIGQFDDGQSNNGQCDDGKSEVRRSDDRITDERRSNEISISSYHEDSGMATTDCSDNIQECNPPAGACFEAPEHDTNTYRNQDESCSNTRPEINSFISGEEIILNVIQEEICTTTDQDNNCSCDTVGSTVSCEYQQYVTVKGSSVLCQDERSVMSENISYAAVEEVENVVSHPDHDFILNSHLCNETEENEDTATNHNPTHISICSEVPNGETQMGCNEPVQIRIEEISNDGSVPMVIESDDEVREANQNHINQEYVYYPPFQTYCATEDNHPPGMQFNGLDHQFQEHRPGYQGPETQYADTPVMPNAAPQMEYTEYASMHGAEQMYPPMYVMPPVYNCRLEVNLLPLSRVENAFIRQGAFAIKYGGFTTILTGVLHFNSEYESCIFESHFMQQPPNHPFQNGAHHYPPQQYPYDPSQEAMPRTESNFEAGHEPEVVECTQQIRKETFADIPNGKRVNMNEVPHQIPVEQAETLHQIPYEDDDVVEVMEIESSDEEDCDQNIVVKSSSHITQSRPDPSAEDILLRVQPLIRRMRQKFGKHAYSTKLKGYLTQNQFQRLRFSQLLEADTVDFSKLTKGIKFEKVDNTKRIRLRNDLMQREILIEENNERQLEPCNRIFIYEIHFRDNCQTAYVVHDAVDFLCPDCYFLKAYVRFMLGLTRVRLDLKITEMKKSDD